MKISIDFKVRSGKSIKPLHGINNSRISLEKPMEELRDAGIPFVRLHDLGGYFGGGLYVDIPNLFPDFSADENNPASYNFDFTDRYFQQLTASGPEIFLRLGVTIENFWWIKSFRINPPVDFAKWARICEHVVRHYNEGWADGYHFNIRYWEIWNEPENPSMWRGTKQQYFDLYKATTLHLRSCFPDIKLGGYASCGFYALNTHKDDDFFKGCLTWFTDFLDFVKQESLPLDFYTWHRYFTDPEILREDSGYIRTELDKRGFTATESIFDEWNYYDGDSPTKWDDMKSAVGASAVAATMIVLQNIAVDKALYYDARPNGSYGGLYYFPSQAVTPTYYAFKAFNRLYALQEEVPVMENCDGIYAMAASNGDESAVLLVNNGKESKALEIGMCNFSGAMKACIIDEAHTFESIPLDLSKTVTMPPHSILLLESKQDILRSTDSNTTEVEFAGISKK